MAKAKNKAKVEEVAVPVDPVASPATDAEPVAPPAAEDAKGEMDMAEVEDELAKDPGRVEAAPVIGNPDRWVWCDDVMRAYEIGGRGLLVNAGLDIVYIPGVKLAPDINGGKRIVPAA